MKRSRLAHTIVLGLALVLLGTTALAQPATTAAPLAEPDNLDAGLYTLGTFAGSNVYLSYLLLGTAADSYMSGVYSDSTAVGIVNEVLYMNSNTLASLNAFMTASEFTAEDSRALNKIKSIYELLSQEGEALIRFISVANDTGEQFQQYRLQVWTEISQLLGLGDS